MTRTSWRAWAAALLACAGCRFERPADVGPPVDAAAIDAVRVCTPNEQTCTAGRYTACDANGQYVTHDVPNGAVDGSQAVLTMRDFVCPMGCDESLPQCADIAVLNGFDPIMDTLNVSPSGMDVVLPRSLDLPAGTVVVNTDAFDASTGLATVADVDGAAVRIPATIVMQTGGGPDILVLKVRTLSVRPGVLIDVRGVRALGIASHFDVYVAGAIDLTRGSGSIVNGNCAGRLALGSTCAGGGGNVHSGGAGANGGIRGLATEGAEPLIGGCVGGEITGLGGGAIQIASRTRIALASSALVDVSGAGAQAHIGLSMGGSSGGTVVLYAPTVTFAEGSAVAGRGGSGGAHGPGGSNVAGVRGPVEGTSGAPSTTCTGCGTGGAGGTETRAPSDGVGTETAGGGGGGSVGICRVANATGVVLPPPGVMRIALRGGKLATRAR